MGLRDGLGAEDASRLLTDEGSGALSLCRIAAEVGCSTTVLYTLFGGKDGLTDALFREGFDRFRRLSALPPAADPISHLYEIAWAYRSDALAEPHYYGPMFSHDPEAIAEVLWATAHGVLSP